VVVSATIDTTIDTTINIRIRIRLMMIWAGTAIEWDGVAATEEETRLRMIMIEIESIGEVVAHLPPTWETSRITTIVADDGRAGRLPPSPRDVINRQMTTTMPTTVVVEAVGTVEAGAVATITTAAAE